MVLLPRIDTPREVIELLPSLPLRSKMVQISKKKRNQYRAPLLAPVKHPALFSDQVKTHYFPQLQIFLYSQ